MSWAAVPHYLPHLRTAPAAHQRRGCAFAEKGVTAYLQRPVQRERLNERFLKSTIRGVQSCESRLYHLAPHALFHPG